MKIRNPRLITAAGWAGSMLIRGLFATLRYQYYPLGEKVIPQFAPVGERYLYAVWHENMLLPIAYFSQPNCAVLISKHADGQLLGKLIQMMGMGMVCGSTNRGGIQAVRQLLADTVPWQHLAVTPDGPQGPRRIVQPGIIYVASRTGMKIVPSGIAYCRPWRANSWDRFAIPKPFSRVVCISGDPVVVPNGLRTAEMEPYRLRVQTEMDRLQGIAERAAIDSHFDSSLEGKTKILLQAS